MNSMDDFSEQKLRAEIAKLNAETEALRPRRVQRALELIKVIGAVAATAAAGYAAITTYRITQLETRLAQQEKKEADAERTAAIRGRDRALADAVLATQQRLRVQQQLTSARRDTAIAVENAKRAAASRDAGIAAYQKAHHAYLAAVAARDRAAKEADLMARRITEASKELGQAKASTSRDASRHLDLALNLLKLKLPPPEKVLPARTSGSLRPFRFKNMRMKHLNEI
jgi:hypothetical protein